MIRASFIDQHFKNSISKYVLYLVILRTVIVISAIFDNVARKYNANHFNNSDSNSSSSNDCNVIGQPIIQLKNNYEQRTNNWKTNLRSAAFCINWSISLSIGVCPPTIDCYIFTRRIRDGVRWTSLWVTFTRYYFIFLVADRLKWEYWASFSTDLQTMMLAIKSISQLERDKASIKLKTW